ncbi:MAG: sulfatase-like hydrolase/transferase [Actinomycetia bacterium]|nr:sulfatase-like hydrolase/transferase [Actinomycetes bacterium]
MGDRTLSTPGVSRALALLVAAGSVPLIALGGLSTPAAVAGVITPSPPNIVLILTDDQGNDMFGPMPRTRASLLDQGVTFSNGISPTSLCCPARAALLSGTYSHTNGVWTNGPPLGGWQAFSGMESHTVATALDDVGYQTGFFGKYLNGWSSPADPVVPAGWDSFSAMRGPSGAGGAYYDYELVGIGQRESFGATPEDYSTDVLATRASDFVTAADPAAPLFVIYAPYGPHAPSNPAPRHVGTWPTAALQPPANEEDMSDKPAFMQSLAPIPKRKLRRAIRKQNESLISVDEGVQKLIEAVGADRAANTLFVFLSDNALLNGDHRLRGKYVPYEGATEIPIALRWDGVIAPGQVDPRIFTIQDVTTTIVEAAGATLPTEGVSYLSGTRDGTVVEGVETTNDGFTRPAYCGWRTEQYLYVRYSNGAGDELYDYALDPDELDNRATDPSYTKTLGQLRATAQPACTPGPPGFRWDAEPVTP